MKYAGSGGVDRWKDKGNAKVREGFVRNKGLEIISLNFAFDIKLVLMDRRDKKQESMI